ncbi:MAG: type II toxin-antitoxin system Phd/YefM family antitoxin [Deltaproteobacteria bacterium]|nr:type II toxin-antitoxin system Phd/YefM family antitoxin [Deltaproteobacteria bacterium]
MTTMNATEFKAKCLTLMDHVQSTGEVISITKRGQEVARLVPSPNPKRRQKLLQQLKGSVQIHFDLTQPTLSEQAIENVLVHSERKIHGSAH